MIDPTVGVLGAAVFASIPAVMAARAAGKVHKEMKPNGGNSMRDALDRLETGVDQLKAGQEVDRELIVGTARVLADIRHTRPARG